MAIRCKEPFWSSVVRMTLAVVGKKRSKVVRQVQDADHDDE